MVSKFPLSMLIFGQKLAFKYPTFLKFHNRTDIMDPHGVMSGTIFCYYGSRDPLHPCCQKIKASSIPKFVFSIDQFAVQIMWCLVGKKLIIGKKNLIDMYFYVLKIFKWLCSWQGVNVNLDILFFIIYFWSYNLVWTDAII